MALSKLKTRVVSATILVALLLVVTFAPPLIFSIAVCAICLVVLRELLLTFKMGTKPPLLILDYIAALALMVTVLVQMQVGGVFYLILTLFIMAALAVSVINHEKISFSDVCASIFAVLYSVLFLLPLSFMRHQENGLALVFLAFVGAWIPDTAAYFVGCLFGKHKLIEAISPKKTVEGAVGAIAGSVAGFLIYGGILTSLGYYVNFFGLVILSLICGVVAQLGDLSASMIKRTYQAKDFGNLIPGHGGLLDRVDSLFFVAPVVYYFISFFPVLM